MAAKAPKPLKSNVFLVVMAGGSGTRFWPKSRSWKPKQLLSFGNNRRSLLQQTLDRFSGWIPKSQQLIVTTRSLEKAVRKNVGAGPVILAEPEGRNTAPCLYWAAQWIKANGLRSRVDPVMVVMPADHLIADPKSFVSVVKKAVDRALNSSDLVTLGITPTRPETGYGYLETEAQAGMSQGQNPLKVLKFVEKPDLERARIFQNSGRHLWNGGMFVWRVSTFLNEMNQALPEYNRIWESGHGNVPRNVKNIYSQLQAVSIDYGLMEKSSRVVTFPLDCGWDDLGSWLAVENPLLGWHRGEGGISSTKRSIFVESKGNIVDVQSKTTVLLGCEDLVVVEDGTCLLILPKSRTQDLRKVVDRLKKENPREV